MLKVSKNGDLFSLCENPRWIRLQKNGCYGLCDQKSAEGIVIEGVVYNLLGNDIGGQDTVVCEEVDGGNYIFQQQKISDELILALLEA